ncbi:MAG: helix-turn-helix transcriptional regulator [Ruminococcaceae bacterium]|nr:helix-turn-helix transcriptional regulator [Oscillospiraceae bacterium]
MKKEWADVLITEISFAMYVPPNTGGHIHKNRPFHGFVLNDAQAIRDYCFSNGRVMHTEGGVLFYLPKGSSYDVKTVQSGGCYAINFDALIEDAPFSIKLRNTESIKKSFQVACDEWKHSSPLSRAAAMRAVYDAILEIQREASGGYVPNKKIDRIAPALAEIERRFTDPALNVVHLARLCQMSEVYFRTIFAARFGISPKEYIIQKRMEYAKGLLTLGELEVNEVARLCGYTEPCHFSREFKKRLGMAPKYYL